jgi:Zn-dependent protease
MFGTSGTKWKIMTLGGHPIFVQPFFLLLIAYIVFAGIRSIDDLVGQLLIAPALILSIIWHELGHALTTEKFGYGKSTIVLHGFGGVAINRNGSHRVPKQALAISAAGPFASAVLAGIFTALYFLVPLGGVAKDFVGIMAFINGILTVFNLLPINPMDGGHMVLHGLRWAWRNERKALLWSAYTSLAVLALVGAGFFALDMGGFFLIILLALFVWQNVQIIQQVKGAR